jgi:hypothetical protein
LEPREVFLQDSPSTSENEHQESCAQGGDDDVPKGALQTLLHRARLRGGDWIVALILVAASAALWCRAIPLLGLAAPILGAAIGLAITYLVREFC